MSALAMSIKTILREPFALIPLGAASTAVAVATGIFLLIKRACQ